MEPKQFFEDLQKQINQILETSPAKDIEKNVRALLTQGLAKLDVVTREEFDVLAQQHARLGERLAVLEKRVAELEAMLQASVQNQTMQ